MPKMGPPPWDPRVGTVVAGKIMPVIVTALFGYASWTITIPLATNYLLRPPAYLGVPRRRTQAIIILVIYYLLLFIVESIYVRLFLTVTFRPGIVKKNIDDVERDENGDKVNEKLKGWPSLENPPPGLENFYKYDVFVSEGTGRPIWCQNCRHWKPDRTRHCSELNRCVRKMDHYCPWVGGVVAESSFKWFIQFCAYSSCLAIFLIVVLAYYTADRVKVDPGRPNVNMIVIICASGFLGLFTTVMCGTSSYLAMTNSTSVEQLAGQKSMSIAVLIPPHIRKELEALPPDAPRNYKTVTYPLTPPAPDPPTSSSTETTSPPPVNPEETRMFAVLHTKPGENLWDLGRWQNWKSVMGEHVWEWFVPLTRSPILKYEGQDSAYQMGPVVERLKIEAGLVPPTDTAESRERRRRRRKSGRRSGNESSNEANGTKSGDGQTESSNEDKNTMNHTT